MKRLILAIVTVLAFSASSYAIPTLQLNIGGGTYNNLTQTVDAPGNTFKLYAYLMLGPGDNFTTVINDDYYVSAAVSPGVTAPASLGSFAFDGLTYSVTAGGMEYGTPPFEEANVPDLPAHGIFPTYFQEFGFKFDASVKTSAYNTQDNPGTEPTLDSSGEMYYVAFDVDVTNLDPDYIIHFDLYNSELKKGKNADTLKIKFAPFSHDASSIPSTQVPEPSSLLLLGTGLIALALRRRGRK